MKTKHFLILFLLSIWFCFNLYSQTSGEEVGGQYFSNSNSSGNPCLTTTQYENIELRCNANAAKFIGNTSPNIRSGASAILNWPLRASAELHDCDFYFISAHVDHNPASTVFKDYNCGSICYDGHRGTDIAIWPFPFYKMDNDLVEVIAAASGTIIDKHDGEFDKNCVGVGSGLTANYIVIQHTDGSRALYLHMKKNSLTAKVIGQNVETGELLGVVGSSGSSSGPHLHFEIWEGNTVSTLVDPFTGSCNVLNDSTWWVAQKAYTEPAILKASVHTTDVVLPPCPETETLNESPVYMIPFQGPGLPPGYAKFYIFMRNETSNTVVEMKILRPDSTVFNSWTHDCTNNYTASYWGYSKKLPVIEGEYTFQAVYNGDTCSQKFNIVTATGTNDINEAISVSVSPNPTSSSIKFRINRAILDGEIDIYNSSGQLVDKLKNISGQNTEIQTNKFSNGVYYFVIISDDIILGTKTLVINK